MNPLAQALIWLSLAVNIAVLTAVGGSLLRNASWTDASYGRTSPARGIVLAIYLAIALVSAVLLIFPQPAAVAALLLVQVLYKVMTPLTVGTLANPVVVSNLAIAALHTVTLGALAWQSELF